MQLKVERMSHVLCVLNKATVQAVVRGQSKRLSLVLIVLNNAAEQSIVDGLPLMKTTCTNNSLVGLLALFLSLNLLT